VLGVFSEKLSGKPQKNEVVAYLATHNTNGSSGNTVETVEDKDLECSFRLEQVSPNFLARGRHKLLHNSLRAGHLT